MARRSYLLILTVLVLVASLLVGQAAEVQAARLRASAGGVGGAWYTVLAGVADLINEVDPDIIVDVVPGGGLINPARVGMGDVELAFLFPPQAAAAREGRDPFTEAYPDIRIVAGGFGTVFGQFVVAEETGLTSIEEIVAKKPAIRIATERMGTTDEWLHALIWEHYGLDYKDIASWGGQVIHAGYGDQVTLMKDRHVDAIFQNIAVPSTGVLEIQTTRNLRLLPMSEELQAALIEKYAFAPGEIPAGSYSGMVKEPVRTVAVNTTLAVHKDVPEEIVYRITKIIAENADRVRATHDSAQVFDPATAWQHVGAPLHPGAERYYREAGYLTD